LAVRSWLPLTASVLSAASVPAATLTIFRSLPVAPTETVLDSPGIATRSTGARFRVALLLPAVISAPSPARHRACFIPRIDRSFTENASPS
jgi:hypothetical protein